MTATAPARVQLTDSAPSPRHDARERTTGAPLNPVGPPTPAPAAPLGASGASGGSGFFFFGIAALLALSALFVAALIGTVRTTVAVAAPQPFLLLPERPG